MRIIALPKSVTKVTKKKGQINIEYTDSVDRAKYTLNELSRAALRDTAKFVRKVQIEEAKKQPGMKRNKRVGKSFQYWVRKRETDLQTGIKHNTWYGVEQELGTKNQPKREIIGKSVKENIDQIREIQSQYLNAIEDENKAKALIDENEFKSGDNDE